MTATSHPEHPELADDVVDIAALLHDNGFQWDDANAVNAILSHHGLVVRAAREVSRDAANRLGEALG